MAKYRITTYYTACIETDVVADSEAAAIEQVRANPIEESQESLRSRLDDIQESWTQHRTAWQLP